MWICTRVSDSGKYLQHLAPKPDSQFTEERPGNPHYAAILFHGFVHREAVPVRDVLVAGRTDSSTPVSSR